jgi:hypothetical protein
MQSRVHPTQVVEDAGLPTKHDGLDLPLDLPFYRNPGRHTPISGPQARCEKSGLRKRISILDFANSRLARNAGPASPGLADLQFESSNGTEKINIKQQISPIGGD